MSLIFLSHTEKDFPLADEIARGLEEAGYSAWYYERDTLAGMSYLLQITRAIESCDTIVLIASPNSITSDQVTREIIGAFERSIPILPICMGITPAELKERQPEWRHALGGAAMVTFGVEGLPRAISSIVEGLGALGVEPGRAEAPSASILSTSEVRASKAVANRVLSQRASLEGERKQITVLSAEVTGLSDMDPEEQHNIAGSIIEMMSSEINLYEGTVASITGEGLTAIFGAPITHEDDPARALHAAISIRKLLESRAEGLSLRGGVNTGLVIVGSIGDDLSMEFTAIGNTLALASDLRDVSQAGTILLSKDTRDLAEDYFDFTEAEGLYTGDVAEAIYELTGTKHAATRVEASIAKGLSHFVGREREHAQLSECLEKAKKGEGQVVGIVGEAGVGKSRTVLEFLEGLPSDEYTLLEGGCYHYGDAMPYLPIIEMLKGFFNMVEGDDEEAIREKLAMGLADYRDQQDRLLFPLQELLSLRVDDGAYLSIEPRLRRERVFEAIRLLLIMRSQRSPLVIVVEDLHWIDRTSEEFLSSLVDSITSSRILLALLYRPEYVSPWTSKSFYTTIRVDQLPEKTSEELISSILTDGEVSKEVTGLIIQKASGNPLFIEELTHGLLEDGSVKKEDGRYVLAAKVVEIEVPDTIQGMIAARLDRLQEELKKLMQVASVIGREFAYRLLASITQMQDELKRSLSDLQESELIYEKSLFPELEYIFKHALTQEVAYNSLLKKKRRELHGSIGTAIEDLYPDRLEEFFEVLAYHYARSDDTNKAIRYLKLSGDKATRNYSNAEAVNYYREILRILESLPETKERNREELGVLHAISDLLTFLNYPESSLEILESAEALSRKLEDQKSLMTAYRKLGLYYSLKGNMALALDYSEKGFDEAEKLGAVDLVMQGASDICPSLVLTGELSRTASIAKRALRLLEECQGEGDLFIGAWTAYSALCGYCGYALSAQMKIEEANTYFEKGLASARQTEDKFGAGFIEAWYAASSYWVGDAGATIKHAQNAIDLFEETGINVLLGFVWSFLAGGYYLLGEHETALHHAQKGLSLHRAGGVPSILPIVDWHMGLAYLACGDIENAKKCADEAVTLCQEFNSKLNEGVAWVLHGRVIGECDPSKADITQQEIFQGISIADAIGLGATVVIGHLFLGEVFEKSSRKDEAIENLKIAEKMGREMGMGYWLTRTQEALAKLGQ